MGAVWRSPGCPGAGSGAGSINCSVVFDLLIDGGLGSAISVAPSASGSTHAASAKHSLAGDKFCHAEFQKLLQYSRRSPQMTRETT